MLSSLTTSTGFGLGSGSPVNGDRKTIGVGVGVGVGVGDGGAVGLGAVLAAGALEVEAGSGALAEVSALQEARSMVAPIAARPTRTLPAEVHTMWALYVLGPEYPGMCAVSDSYVVTTTAAAPTLRVERALMREHGGLLAAIDEVGRGALAGPVSVGVVVISAQTIAAPDGVRDSKLLAVARRVELAPLIVNWCVASNVGHATNAEIDVIGIIAALRLAGRRALGALADAGIRPAVVLLDGSHDWLTPPRLSLFDDFTDDWQPPPVVMKVKADMTCSAVAAASVLAKVERDVQMVKHAKDYPAYGWDGNKGYAAPEHLAALRNTGPTPLHRVSWNLPGVN